MPGPFKHFYSSLRKSTSPHSQLPLSPPHPQPQTTLNSDSPPPSVPPQPPASPSAEHRHSLSKTPHSSRSECTASLLGDTDRQSPYCDTPRYSQDSHNPPNFSVMVSPSSSISQVPEKGHSPFLNRQHYSSGSNCLLLTLNESDSALFPSTRPVNTGRRNHSPLDQEHEDDVISDQAIRSAPLNVPARIPSQLLNQTERSASVRQTFFLEPETGLSSDDEDKWSQESAPIPENSTPPPENLTQIGSMASSKYIEQHNRKNPSPENSTPPLENLTYTSSKSIPSSSKNMEQQKRKYPSSENATSPTEDLKLTQCKNVPSSKWNKQQKRKRSTTPEVSDSQILPESLSHDNEAHSKIGASRIQKIYGTFSRKRTRRSQSPHAYTTSKTSFTAPWSIFTDDRERKRLSAFFNNEKGSSLSGASQNPLPTPVVLGPPLLNSPDEIHETVSPITPFKSLTQSRGEQEQGKDKHESQSRIKKWITSLSMSPRKRQKVAESRQARVDIQPLVTSVSQLDLGANIMKSGEERCGSRMLPGLIIRSLTADEVKTIDNQEESKSQSQEPMSQDSQPLLQMLLGSQPLSQEPMSQDSQPLSQMPVDSQPLSQEPMSQMPVDSQSHSQEPMFQDSQPLSQMSLDSQPLSQELMSQYSQPLSQMLVDSQPRSQQLMSQDSQNSQQPMSQIQ